MVLDLRRRVRAAVRDGGVPAIATRTRDRTQDALARRFGVDTRALAAFRVALGVLLLADLALRSRNLVAFYTDRGVLPRAALAAEFPAFARVSLHAVSGAALVQAALFLLAGAAALSLLLGYRTRTATVVSWLLLVSLHARNPLVLNAGDSVLRRLLFWGMFLPLGERWAVDALGGDGARRRVTSAASAALLLQVVLVYTTNVALKLQGEVWVRGDGVRYVMSLDQLTFLLANHVARYPRLLVALDRLWLALLVSSVLLVVLTDRRRTALVSLFIGAHAGMALTVRMGLFAPISIAALLPFLPGGVWDAVSRGLQSDRFRPLRRRLAGFGSHGAGGLGRWSRSGRRTPSGSRLAGRLAAIRRRAGRLAPAFATVILSFLLVWNAVAVGLVDAPDGVKLPVDPEDRRWDMFAPDPLSTDGWYVVPGQLESGSRIDAFRLAPVRWDRPPDVARTYPSARWRKYLVGLRYAGDDDLERGFASYLCHRWNDRHDDTLERLAIYYVEQPTRLDGPEPIRTVELSEHSCSTPAT